MIGGQGGYWPNVRKCNKKRAEKKLAPGMLAGPRLPTPPPPAKPVSIVCAWPLKLSSVPFNAQTKNLARLACHGDLERPAADFTIGRKPLGRHGGVDRQVERLPAEWALHGFGYFHKNSIKCTNYRWCFALTRSESKPEGLERTRR